MTTIQQDIAALAEQIGVPASTVEFMANHIADTMGEEMSKTDEEVAQVEMMRAGVESSRRTMRTMAIRSLTRSADIQGVVYQELKRRGH